MDKKIFDSFPSFETDRLRIRAFEPSDFDNYVSWHDCANIIYYNEGLYDFKADNREGYRAD